MMTERLNAALSLVKPSAIRVFSRLAKETPGCIALTLGEPDFDTPEAVRASAKQALDLGETHYIMNNGTASLRAAIAAFEREHNGMDYTEDEIIVTVGATEALFTALFGILEPGDEVIVPTPAFGLYESIITMCRAGFVPLPTGENGFQISAEALEARITPRTKAILLNSPNNPTGTILTRESLETVRAAAARHDLFVICDDVYRQLIYEGEYHSFAEFRELRDRILVVQSFSKPYAMTGWRVGYLMADAPLMPTLSKVHQFAVVSAPSTAMRACETALGCDPSGMLEVYRARRAFMLKRLSEIGLPVQAPEGAFYMFPSIARFGMDSGTFCRRMIAEAGLAATPGACFGCEDHIRLTYCYADDVLKEGMDRLERFVRSLEA